jgi:hypothetical protein
MLLQASMKYSFTIKGLSEKERKRTGEMKQCLVENGSDTECFVKIFVLP